MDAKTQTYDRTTEDVTNLVHMEHVNVTQPDQRPTTLFYVVALGGTRDPYLMVGLDNMWVNFGRTQLHMPSRDPQSREVLFELEHEIRSLKHPLYGRPLVNRNPAQTNTAYRPGQDLFRGVY
jgi:hypothetical protein